MKVVEMTSERFETLRRILREGFPPEDRESAQICALSEISCELFAEVERLRERERSATPKNGGENG